MKKRAGHKITEKTKLKISKSNKGRKRTEEQRKRISEGKKGKPGPWLGKKRSEETKRKISESCKKAMRNEEVKDKIRCGCEKRFRNNPSSIEVKVAKQLEKYKIKYIYQKGINRNHFIIDFYLPEYQLVVECNGDYWHSRPERKKRDKELEEYVLSKGKDILWLWEHEINDEWFDIADYLEVE